jgi:hypothetical protein
MSRATPLLETWVFLSPIPSGWELHCTRCHTREAYTSTPAAITALDEHICPTTQARP